MSNRRKGALVRSLVLLENIRVVVVLTDEATRSMNWGSGIDHVGGRSKELISDSNDGGSESRRSEI